MRRDHFCRQPDLHLYLFSELDEEQQREDREIIAAHTDFVRAGENRVKADPFVIALAYRRDMTVVSEERRPGNRNTSKIQRLCRAQSAARST